MSFERESEEPDNFGQAFKSALYRSPPPKQKAYDSEQKNRNISEAKEANNSISELEAQVRKMREQMSALVEQCEKKIKKQN